MLSRLAYREPRLYCREQARWWGGYIRIGKVQFSDHHQMLQDLAANIGETISQQVFNDILQMLYEEKLLTQRETQLLLATTSDEVPRSRCSHPTSKYAEKNHSTSR